MHLRSKRHEVYAHRRGDPIDRTDAGRRSEHLAHRAGLVLGGKFRVDGGNLPTQLGRVLAILHEISRAVAETAGLLASLWCKSWPRAVPLAVLRSDQREHPRQSG